MLVLRTYGTRIEGHWAYSSATHLLYQGHNFKADNFWNFNLNIHYTIKIHSSENYVTVELKVTQLFEL